MTNCRICGIELDDDSWYKTKKNHNDCICKTCFNNHNKKYIRKYQKEHPEKMRSYQRKYYRANKDRILSYQRRWRKTKEGRLSRLKTLLKRKAKSRGIKHNFTFEEWKDKLNNTKGKCEHCGRYVGQESLQMDYIIPATLNENNNIYDLDDIQFICQSCKTSKSYITNQLKNDGIDWKLASRLLMKKPELFKKYFEDYQDLDNTEIQEIYNNTI